MKEFWTYTALRLLVFVATFGIVAGIWALTAGEVSLLWTLMISFLVSGAVSFVVLDRQRAAFAAKVETRATRAVENARSKED
ncbi:MAG: DUF4229 domain-containing protein [Nocardioides sp.]